MRPILLTLSILAPCIAFGADRNDFQRDSYWNGTSLYSHLESNAGLPSVDFKNWLSNLLSREDGLYCHKEELRSIHNDLFSLLSPKQKQTWKNYIEGDAHAASRLILGHDEASLANLVYRYPLTDAARDALINLIAINVDARRFGMADAYAQTLKTHYDTKTLLPGHHRLLELVEKTKPERAKQPWNDAALVRKYLFFDQGSAPERGSVLRMMRLVDPAYVITRLGLYQVANCYVPPFSKLNTILGEADLRRTLPLNRVLAFHGFLPDDLMIRTDPHSYDVVTANFYSDILRLHHHWPLVHRFLKKDPREMVGFGNSEFQFGALSLVGELPELAEVYALKLVKFSEGLNTSFMGEVIDQSLSKMDLNKFSEFESLRQIILKRSIKLEKTRAKVISHWIRSIVKSKQEIEDDKYFSEYQESLTPKHFDARFDEKPLRNIFSLYKTILISAKDNPELNTEDYGRSLIKMAKLPFQTNSTIYHVDINATAILLADIFKNSKEFIYRPLMECAVQEENGSATQEFCIIALKIILPSYSMDIAPLPEVENSLVDSLANVVAQNLSSIYNLYSAGNPYGLRRFSELGEKTSFNKQASETTIRDTALYFVHLISLSLVLPKNNGLVNFFEKSLAHYATLELDDDIKITPYKLVLFFPLQYLWIHNPKAADLEKISERLLTGMKLEDSSIFWKDLGQLEKQLPKEAVDFAYRMAEKLHIETYNNEKIPIDKIQYASSLHSVLYLNGNDCERDSLALWHEGDYVKRLIHDFSKRKIMEHFLLRCKTVFDSMVDRDKRAVGNLSIEFIIDMMDLVLSSDQLSEQHEESLKVLLMGQPGRKLLVSHRDGQRARIEQLKRIKFNLSEFYKQHAEDGAYFFKDIFQNMLVDEELRLIDNHPELLNIIDKQISDAITLDKTRARDSIAALELLLLAKDYDPKRGLKIALQLLEEDFIYQEERIKLMGVTAGFQAKIEREVVNTPKN